MKAVDYRSLDCRPEIPTAFSLQPKSLPPAPNSLTSLPTYSLQPKPLQPLSSPAFTLLEVLLAITIMAVVTTITYMAFSTMTTAWKRGNALSQDLGHGDFVIEQLVMALRSTYSPTPGPIYGFRLEDHGDGPGSSDVISWVKLGQSLVGSETALAGTPHRTLFTIESDKKGNPCAAVKAWSLLDQTEEFDPEKVPYTFLSDHVVGFNCKCSTNDLTGDTEWSDEWEKDDLTNHVPRVLEVTLYMKPLEYKDAPVEIHRIVEIPTAELTWQAATP